jgi:hypothetical protein
VLERNHPAHDTTYVTNTAPTTETAANRPSLATPAQNQWRTPAARRAPMSHHTVMRPKATTKNRPDHLVPAHSPRQTPATSRHGRHPSQGPKPDVTALGSSAPALSASRARERSRSRSRAQNAASAQNMTMMSSRPVRECTKWCPSKASRNAAMVPSNVEPNIRRAARPTMRIDRVPRSATEKRHPNDDVAPKMYSPTAMTHLPTGGCTTRSPSVPNTSGVPAVNSSSGFFNESGTRISTPYSSIE